MNHVTARTAQRDFNNLLERVARYNEPITIVSDDDNVGVLLSMEEWRNIQETLYLQSIPNMAKSIKAAAAEPLSDGIDATAVNWNV